MITFKELLNAVHSITMLEIIVIDEYEMEIGWYKTVLNNIQKDFVEEHGHNLVETISIKDNVLKIEINEGIKEVD